MSFFSNLARLGHQSLSHELADSCCVKCVHQRCATIACWRQLSQLYLRKPIKELRFRDLSSGRVLHRVQHHVSDWRTGIVSFDLVQEPIGLRKRSGTQSESLRLTSSTVYLMTLVDRMATLSSTNHKCNSVDIHVCILDSQLSYAEPHVGLAIKTSVLLSCKIIQCLSGENAHGIL
jgi:hypothetical protein